MKLSWMTNQSASKSKQKKSIKNEVEQIKNFQIEKMIDFASSYFFTKMEQRPTNVLSFYNFGNKQINQQFRYEKEKEDDAFKNYVKRKRRGQADMQEMSEQVSRGSILQKYSYAHHEDSAEPVIDILDSRRMNESDLQSSKSSQAEKSDKKSNPSKVKQNKKQLNEKPNQKLKNVKIINQNIKAPQQTNKNSQLPIQSNYDLQDLLHNDTLSNSAFKKSKQSNKSNISLSQRNSEGKSSRNSKKSMSSFHPSQSYQSQSDKELSEKSFQNKKQNIANDVVKNIDKNISQSFKKQKKLENNNQDTQSKVQNQEANSGRKTNEKSTNKSTTDKKVQWKNLQIKPNNRIEQNILNFQFKAVNVKKQEDNKNQKSISHQISNQNNIKSIFQLPPDSQLEQDNQSIYQTESSKCFDQVDLNELPDFNDSNVFPQKKFSRLFSIEQQQQNLSTIFNNKVRGKEVQPTRAQQSNLSNFFNARPQNNQDMKTLLELERIQLSINQLQNRFQQLMNYQLEFQRTEFEFKAPQPLKPRRRLKLGIVIDLDERKT